MKRSVAFILLSLIVLTSSRPVRVACIGDSITYGHGLDDRDNDSWPAVLQHLLGPDYEVRNFGFSARTMLMDGNLPYMKEPLYDSVKTWLPDIVTIMLGTNDTKPFNWKTDGEERFRKDYLTMMDELRALDSHPKLYLCLPPWVPQAQKSINDSTLAASVNPIIRALGDRRWIEVIDTHSTLEGKVELFPDLLHPGKEGAAMLAHTVFDTFSRFGDTGKPGLRILFIGDSITDGAWGKADSKPSAQRQHYDGNHLYGHSYAAQCASFLLAEYPERRYKFFNRGIGGDTLAGIDARWESDVLAEHPDVISLYVGINDVGTGELDFAAWESRYRSVLDRSLKADPDVKFVLCPPFIAELGAVSHSDSFGLKKQTVARLGEIVRKIAADYGAVLVPVDEEMARLIATDRSGDARYWCWDGIHPTYPAHKKLSDLWLLKADDIL